MHCDSLMATLCSIEPAAELTPVCNHSENAHCSCYATAALIEIRTSISMYLNVALSSMKLVRKAVHRSAENYVLDGLLYEVQRA